MSKPSFTITIRTNFIDERPAGKEWLVDSEKQGDVRNVPEYGYTPEIIKKTEFQLKLYEQTVEEIDIKAVIAAVNKTD